MIELSLLCSEHERDIGQSLRGIYSPEWQTFNQSASWKCKLPQHLRRGSWLTIAFKSSGIEPGNAPQFAQAAFLRSLLWKPKDCPNSSFVALWFFFLRRIVLFGRRSRRRQIRPVIQQSLCPLASCGFIRKVFE